jgi:mannose/fructose/N-acetylgalactosamine-specific phosphotransferase system component IID
MKTNKRKSFFAAIRSMGLALIILAVSTWFIIGVFYEMLGGKIKYEHPDIWLSQYWNTIVLGLYILIIAVACFYLVRKNPKSIWFVPLICNAYCIVGIVYAIVENAFWTESDGIILCFGLVLSITTSILGARIGKRNNISDNQ